METPSKTVSSFSVNNSPEDLSLRINYMNEAIHFNKSSNALEYTLVASIEPAIINGQKLAATCVTGTFGRSYVGFHSKGEKIGGEILSIDVSIPEEPVILQSAQSESFEFNDIFLSQDENKLWLCGDEKNSSGHQAFAMEFDIDENLAHAENYNWSVNANAYSGNSITETVVDGESYLWFTSGSNGGLEVFDASNPTNIEFSFEASGTKHFDAGRSTGAVIFGTDENHSTVRVFDLNNTYAFTDYLIPYDVSQLGKNAIFVDRDLAYLAMGNSGLLVLNLRNGDIVASFKAEGGTANSVFVEKDFIYLAYGSAGLFILDKANMESLGNWKYDGSCNFVFVDHETVYIANGDGEGFLILKKE